jgi:hypothetical protein
MLLIVNEVLQWVLLASILVQQLYLADWSKEMQSWLSNREP